MISLGDRRRHAVIEHDESARGLDGGVHAEFFRALVEVVLHHHEGVGAPGLDGVERGVHVLCAGHCQAQAVSFLQGDEQPGVVVYAVQRLHDVAGGGQDGFAAQAGADHDQRVLCRLECSGDRLGVGAQIVVEVVGCRRAGVQRMGNGEPERGDPAGPGMEQLRGHVVQPGGRGRGHEHWAVEVLAFVAYRAGVPFGDTGGLGQRVMTVAYRLAQRQRQPGGDLGDVLAQHKDRIAAFDLAQRPAAVGVGAHQLQRGLAGGGIRRAHAVAEIVGTDQMAECEVVFQRGARRSDADQAIAVGEGRFEVGQDGVHVLRFEQAVGVAGQRLSRTVLAVDEAGAEAAAVTKEIMVDLAVVAVLDPLEDALARARAGVAAQRAVAADTGGVLHVPLAGVGRAQRLVGKHAGGADLDQIAREFAVEGTVGMAPEIDVLVRTEHTQIVAIGIVPVVAHAAVAGDTAVHLVIDEGAEILIAMGPLGAAVASARMPGHEGHVLQVAFAAFLAHRAVVRVVDH